MVVLSALRPRHWSKNLLVLVAPLGAGAIAIENLLPLVISFLSLSAAASGTYLLNDVRDREQDALHPTKKLRVIASGKLAPRPAVLLALTLLAFAISLMTFTTVFALAAVILYSVVANLYSLWLRRVPALDVVILASLFVLRIYVGALVVSVEVSNWLLATSFFIFLSLASAKRFIELSRDGLVGDTELLHGRGYLPSDRQVIQVGGLSTGLISAMLLGQWVETLESLGGGELSQLMWLAVPLWVYWVSRLWILTARGKVQDDPVEFVIRDNVSYLVASAILALYMLSKGVL